MAPDGFVSLRRPTPQSYPGVRCRRQGLASPMPRFRRTRQGLRDSFAPSRGVLRQVAFLGYFTRGIALSWVLPVCPESR
jgi:hypothetical protein